MSLFNTPKAPKPTAPPPPPPVPTPEDTSAKQALADRMAQRSRARGLSGTIATSPTGLSGASIPSGLGGGSGNATLGGK